VTATNSAGTSPVSNVVTITPADTVAPAAPTLTATVSGTDISLSWPAVTDPTGPVTYRLHRTTSASCTTTAPLIWTGTTTAHTDTGLDHATTYRYCATATDAAGNRSPSPPPPRPPPPRPRSWSRPHRP
jgi:fibronectin type 3 domain-containing protein